jgi:hypothetical protein
LESKEMKKPTKLLPRMYFSYGQFMIYDASVSLPGCLWTEAHTAQGFARRDSTVCVGTLLDEGHAVVTARLSRFSAAGRYDRVIAVPFQAVDGNVIIEGPEENEVTRSIRVPMASYRLVVAQRLAGTNKEVIDIFFERLGEPLQQSKVIVADDQLDVPAVLVESAEVA